MKKLFTQLAIALLLPMALWAQAQGPVSLEGRWAEGENRAVFRRAGLTFVGNGSLLQVFETVQSVSGNLYRPRSGAVLLMEDVIEDIWVRSDAQYVYAACGKAGVAIIEFDPVTKSFGDVVSRYDTPGTASGVAHWAGDNYLYIADGSGGLRILYIGIPNDPQPKGVYETASPAREVWMHDANTLLIAADEAGLYSLDVTDKDNPQMLDNLALFEIFNGYGSRAWSVIADDTTAFVASGMGGLSIVNIKDMADLQERARWTYRGTPTDMRSVWVSGDFAHVACADAGLLTHIDITDLSLPTGPLYPRLDIRGSSTDLVVVGDTAYVASGVGGHWRVLVAANAPAAGLNRAPMGDQAYDAVISGNYAYVAAGQSGVQVVDLLSASGTDQLLSVAARLDTVGEARAVTKRLSNLYVANGSQGLSIIDVTSPTAPQISALSVAAGDTCYDVEVPPGYYAYLAGGLGGMRVVDIGQSPVAEVGLGRVFTPTSCRGVYVEDTKAYLAATSHVYIYDIGGLSSNTVPSMLQSLDYPALDARDLVVQGDTVVVANGIYGILLWNTTTGEVDTMQVGGVVTDVKVTGRSIYAANGERGFRIFDLSRPEAYTESASYDTHDRAWGLDVVDDRVLVADRRGGLYVLDAEIQPSITLSATHLHFGPVANGKSRPRKFSIRNDGATLLTGSLSMANHQSEFSFSQESFAIPPGDTLFITVTFTPAVAYPDDEGQIPPTTLTIRSNDPDNLLQTVTLQWIGGMVASELIPYQKDIFTLGLWHFNETAGTTISDASGYDHNGVLVGNPEFVASGKTAFGNALRFDEVADRATVPYHADLNLAEKTFTVEYWFKMAQKPSATLGQSGFGILFQRGIGGGNTQIQMYLANEHNPSVDDDEGGLVAFCEGLDRNYLLNTGSIDGFILDHWYHVALSSDGEIMRLYLNGVVQDSTAQAGPLVQALNEPIGIGASAQGNAPFKGTMDEIRISNVARQIWEFHVNRSRIVLSEPALDYGAVLEGETRVLPLTITNPGGENLEITSLQYTKASTSLSHTPVGAQTVLPGSTLTLQVAFAPTSEMALEDTLEIHCSDPTYPIRKVPLTGAGVTTLQAGGYASDALTVGLWHFDETGGTVLTDASPAAMDGEWPSQSRAPDGQFGKALLFVSGQQNMGTITPGESDYLGPRWGGFTVEGWFYFETISGGSRLLMGRGSGNRKQFEVLLQNQTLYATLFDTSEIQQSVTVNSQTTGFLNPNEWIHFAMAYGSGQLRLYINGDLSQEAAFGMPMSGCRPGMAIDTAAVRLGRDWNGGRAFTGRLDEVRISNVERQRWEFNVDMARLDLDQWNLDFDRVLLGENRVLKLRVINSGIDDLAVSNVVSTSGTFVPDHTTFTVAPGTHEILQVTYTPAGLGPHSGALILTTNDPFQSQANVELSGQGRETAVTMAYDADAFTKVLYHFDETQGAQAADSSDYAQHGTVGGNAQWSTGGRYGGALTFDGNNDKVEADTLAGMETLDGDYTVEFWFNLTAKPSTWYSLVTRGSGEENRLEIRLDHTRGLVAALWDSAGISDSLATGSTDTLALDRWYHAALSWDGDSLRLALNKVVQAQKLWHGVLAFAPEEPLVLGADLDGEYGFKGRLDEFRFSRVVRLDWEIHVLPRALDVNPQTLDFATVLQDQSRTLQFGLHNLGDQDLVIQSITGGGDFFSYPDDLGTFTLGRMETRAIAVTYTPTAANQSHEDSLIVMATTGRHGIRLLGASTDARQMTQYGADSHTLLLYHLNETSVQEAPDSSGNDLHASLKNGVSRRQGLFNGRALQFDGKDDWMRIPYDARFDFDLERQDYTVEFYVQTDTVDQGLIHLGWNEDAKIGVDIDRFGRIEAAGFGLGAGPRINDGAWHHVALMFNHITQQGRLYIDGREIWNRAWTSGVPGDLARLPMVVGAKDSTSGYFEGALDEIRLSDIPRERWEFQFVDYGVVTETVGQPEVGKALTLRAHLPRVIVPRQNGVSLHYRQGGGSAYTLIGATASDTTYTATVPASAMTVRGLEYYFLIWATNGDTLTYPPLDPENNPTALTVRQTGMTAGVDLAYREFEMVSVPFVMDHAQADSVLADFGPYNPYEWELYWWDPVHSQDRWNAGLDTAYVHVTDSTSGFHFIPGKSFWLASSIIEKFKIGAGRSVTTDSSYQIVLQPGWNMVSNPYNFTVSWDQCALSDSTSGLYYHDPANSDRPFQNWAKMDPWKGYWIHNPQEEPVTLAVLPKEATSAAVQKAMQKLSRLSQGEWRLRLSAETESSRDMDNYAGLRSRSNNQWDGLDQPEPPGIVSTVDLYFNGFDWRRHPGAYASDMRPTGTEGQVWNVEVAVPKDEKSLRLAWTMDAALPQGWKAYLFHLDEGTSREISGPGDLSVEGGAGKVLRFQIVAGTPEFIAAHKGDIPLGPVDFALQQNYPNPFNPETRIQYSVPKKGQVEIDIYNSLGQHVRSLEDGSQNAGNHEAIWDGRDRHGVKVASGVYICRLKAAGKVAIRKMVLVR